MSSIGESLSRSARRVPEREALVYGDRRLTYVELDREVNRVANALAKKGLSKGDRLALMSPNTDAFVVVFYAAHKLGAIFVPINSSSAPPEAAYILADSGAKIFVFDPALAEVAGAVGDAGGAPTDTFLSAKPLGGYEDLVTLSADESEEQPDVEVLESDDAELLYTSGTTGNPKGALFDHHRILWVSFNIFSLSGLRDGDSFLHVAPLYHAAQLGLCLIPGTLLGAKHVVLPAFDPGQVLDALEEERISVFFGVPTMYQFMMRMPDFAERDFSALQIGMFGAAPMPPSAVEQLSAALPDVNLYSLCGLTEGGPGGIYLNAREVKDRPDASGRSAIPNTEARVVDEEGNNVSPGEVGELALRGETIMKGYWNKPEATAETIRDGWLYTGDLAQADREGYITLVDRAKDMIITGGRNVYSVEVEGALASHPDVLDCAVVATPHPEYGESIAAIVTPREDTELTLEEVREHCRPLISDYKLPHHLVLGEIPRNPSGKITKHILRDTIREEVAQAAEQGKGR